MSLNQVPASIGPLTIHKVEREGELPEGLSRKALVEFLHRSLKPFEDTPHDIDRGLAYAFGEDGSDGGFVLLGHLDGELRTALVMLRTGMQGYIPENLLLFVAADPEFRGRGLGRQIIAEALRECAGPVKLHVEYDNPAKRLYERMGFRSKYAEMRYTP
jgi:ribosomal-protein-alanine N-acetyltransferase